MAPCLTATVILEVMWDWRNVTSSAGFQERAPRWFHINENNHSGRRLHKWLDDYNFVVTNACPQLVSSATQKGTPDPEWLRSNLGDLMPCDLLLVCGRVAKETLAVSGFTPPLSTTVIHIPHPAARVWSKEGIEFVRLAIAQRRSGAIHVESKRFRFVSA